MDSQDTLARLPLFTRFQDDKLVFSASDDCRRVSPSIPDSAIRAHVAYFRVLQVGSVFISGR